MRSLAKILVAVALSLAFARMFTGIVYGNDSPVSFLVLKSRPDLRIERPEDDGPLVAGLAVLDREEPDLAYARLYVAAMHVAPFLSASALLAAFLLWRRTRRPA